MTDAKVRFLRSFYATKVARGGGGGQSGQYVPRQGQRRDVPGRGQNGNTCSGGARVDNRYPGRAREEMCSGSARMEICALAVLESERHAQVGPEVEISSLAGRELVGIAQTV